MGRGVLVVLEGVDGVGKTTQARLLAEALRDRGYEVVLTREPSDGPAGLRLQQYLAGPTRHLAPAEELELFLADRREHVSRVIEPALAAGHIVISDRYYHSSVAYQGALGLDPQNILARNRAFAPPPDLVFLLKMAVDQALARRGRHGPPSPQVSEQPAYLERVAAIYDALSAPECHRVDAAGDPRQINAALLGKTLALLKARKMTPKDHVETNTAV